VHQLLDKKDDMQSQDEVCMSLGRIKFLVSFVGFIERCCKHPGLPGECV